MAKGPFFLSLSFILVLVLVLGSIRFPHVFICPPVYDCDGGVGRLGWIGDGVVSNDVKECLGKGEVKRPGARCGRRYRV